MFKAGDKVVFSEAVTRGEKYDFRGVVVGAAEHAGEWVVSSSGCDAILVFDEDDIALEEEDGEDEDGDAKYAAMMEDYGMDSDALAAEYAAMAEDDHDDYL